MTRRCRQCREPFAPTFNTTQAVCSPRCAVAWVQAEAAKSTERRRKRQEREEKAKQREAKERIKTRAEWAREAQAAFNAWVRERDADLPCVSCGRDHQGQWHAGHYRSVGAAPELRFEPLNTHRQCAPCNTHKSGNAIEYRINLVKRIGEAAVEWLEGPHAPKKYTIDELKEIKRTYAARARQLRKEREQCAA